MNRYLIIAASSAVMAITGCSREELSEPEAKGNRITFEGYTGIQSKVTIGEKDGNAYPLLWYKGDAIGIYDKDTLEINRAEAELFEGSSGKNSGVFQTTTEIAAPKDLDLVITYPSAYVKYTPASITGTVKSEQEQVRANSDIHLGNNCIAYATARLAAGQSEGVKFQLNHKTAFVKVNISSSEFASAELKGVKIWAQGKALSGAVQVNPVTGESTYSQTKDYAGATINRSSALSSEQSVYFTALPCDLAGSEVYVIVNLRRGLQTIEIPVKITGKELKESCLSIISISDLKLSDNVYDWYNPVETRYIAAFGSGWAYGDQNTYIAQVGGDPVSMDVRARGNFMKVRRPVSLLVHNACEFNISNKNNIVLNGVNGYDGTEYVKIPLNGNYNVSAQALKAGAYLGYSSKIKLLDENDECIWCFNLWGVGSQPEGQQLNGGVIMDRNLGAPLKDIEHKTSARPLDGRGAYYQWGRPFQTGWSASGGLFIGKPTNVTDLEISAQNPEVFFHMKDVTPSQGGDWYLGAHTGSREEHIDDLWGNQNVSGEFVVGSKGTKSIYDPCPKGWMVASPAILNEMYKAARLDDSDANMYRLVYTAGSETVTIPFGGCKWGSNGGNCDNSNKDICALWSNSTVTSYEQPGANAHMLYYRFKETGWSEPEKQSGNRSHGYPVRCMKDDESR